MLRRLFSSRGNGKSASAAQSMPRASTATATLAWSENHSPEEQDFARASLSLEIALAEDEQKILKQQGDVARVIRRQRGRRFDQQEKPQRDMDGSPIDYMIDEQGQDWSPAAVWAAGLQTNPLWIDEDERESLSPPDWAVSTAMEVVRGNFKPAMFDWCDDEKPLGPIKIESPLSFVEVEMPLSPAEIELPLSPVESDQDSEDGLADWCASLMDSAFGLTAEEVEDDYFGRSDLPVKWDRGVSYSFKVKSGRGMVFHEAPIVEADSAVIRDVSGGVIPYHEAFRSF